MFRSYVIAAFGLAFLAPLARADEVASQADNFGQFLKSSYDAIEGAAETEYRFVPSWLHPMGNELLKPRTAIEDRCKSAGAAFVQLRDEEGKDPKRQWTGLISGSMGTIPYRRTQWVDKMFERRADKTFTGYRAQGAMAQQLYQIVSAQARGAFGQFECRNGGTSLWFVDLLPDTTGIMHQGSDISFTTAVRVRIVQRSSAPPPVVVEAPPPSPDRVVSAHPIPD
jgi:hypothetical protein